MMTGKSLVTGLSFLVAISVLASCGPQKRAPDIKGTKLGGPGPTGVSPTAQVSQESGNLDQSKLAEKSLAAKKGSVVEPIISAESKVIKSTNADGSGSGLLVNLIEKDGNKIELQIPESVGTAKGKAKTAKTNAFGAEYKCEDPNQLISECDKLSINVTVATMTATNELVNKELLINRIVSRDRNVVRISNIGSEEVHGSALIETFSIVMQGADKNEVKVFSNVKIVGADRLDNIKQIQSQIQKEGRVYSISVSGLPIDKQLNYSNNLEITKEEEKIIELKEANTGLKLRVEMDKVFDIKNIKAPTAQALAQKQALDSATAIAAEQEAVAASIKSEKAGIANATAISKEQEEVTANLAAERKIIKLAPISVTEKREQAAPPASINPRDRN